MTITGNIKIHLTVKEYCSTNVHASITYDVGHLPFLKNIFTAPFGNSILNKL
jgi:hypothetical protein